MFSLLLVDYNTLGKTVEYWHHCRRMLPEGSRHTVIVENGSSGSDLALLEAVYGQGKTLFLDEIPLLRFEKEDWTVVYCRSGENLGYARGNNLAAQIACAFWNDAFLIVSNNDLIFTAPVDLKPVCTCLEQNPQIGAIGPAISGTDGRAQSPRRWMPPYRRLVLIHWVPLLEKILSPARYQSLWDGYFNDAVPTAPEGYCPWLSGCFLILRRTAFETVGGFDPHTFLYCEEPILSKRLEKAGFRMYYFPVFSLIHDHGGSTKTALSHLKTQELDFLANCYLYEAYLNTPRWLIAVAKWNFAVYKGLFRLRQKFKRSGKGGKP